MKNCTEATLFTFIVIWVVIATICAFAWDYSISTWLVHFGKPDTFKLWYGFILGFTPVVRRFAIPVAVITWIAMMFI